LSKKKKKEKKEKTPEHKTPHANSKKAPRNPKKNEKPKEN
jgi:hypothetical protein